jgi:hypothetical protein
MSEMRYLTRRGERYPLIWTELLEARGDMVPCDETGRPLNEQDDIGAPNSTLTGEPPTDVTNEPAAADLRHTACA